MKLIRVTIIIPAHFCLKEYAMFANNALLTIHNNCEILTPITGKKANAGYMNKPMLNIFICNGKRLFISLSVS